MNRYCFIILLISMILIVSCSVNDPEVAVNKEYFIGNWKSNNLLEKLEFTATNAKWFINYKKDTTIKFDSNLINSISYDSNDSNYLIMYYKGWELYRDENRIDFLDTFTVSPGKNGYGKSTFEYSVKSDNSFYLKGRDSDPILFVRN